MNIKTKLELHQLAIKLVDAIAYEKPISEIKAIVDDLSIKSLLARDSKYNIGNDLNLKLLTLTN
jgi:hypothetical protein